MKFFKTTLLFICLLFVFTACSAPKKESVPPQNESTIQDAEEGQPFIETATEEDPLPIETLAEAENLEPGLSEMDTQGLQYTLFLIETSATLSEALDGLSTQSTMMGGDITLLLDDDWKMATVIYMATIQMAAQSFIDYDMALIPEYLHEVHNLIVLGSHDFIDSMNYFAQGIDNLDASALETSTQLLQTGSGYIIQATEKLSELD